MMKLKYIEFITGKPHMGMIDYYPSAWMGWLVTDTDADDMKSYLNGLNSEVISFFQEVFAHAKPKLDVMLRILGELKYTKGNLSFIISDIQSINTFILSSDISLNIVESMLILSNEGKLTFYYLE